MGTKYSVPERDKQGNRIGYTTGSNAAAAAKAATIALLTGEWPDEVTVSLPIGETTMMTPVEREGDDESAYCCMVKDAGDDPDVTHGALICARVCRSDTGGVEIDGGQGVGRVTMPGLGLEVGGPAINPVPREQITDNVTDAVCQVCPDVDGFFEQHGLSVTISVPEGEKLAQKTLNPRLGIVGGISILGTTGKVFPYSTAAWRASVIQAVEMAAHNSVETVVLATGGRSERYAQGIFTDLPDYAFVEMSVFTGPALDTCIENEVEAVALVGMIGKTTKIAQGHMVTHVAGNQVDFDFLAQACRDVGAPTELVEAVANANTARHFLELCQEYGEMAPVQRVTELALQSCETYVGEQGGDLGLEYVLVDFSEGKVLGRAKPEPRHRRRRAGSKQHHSTLVERLATDPAGAYDDEETMR